MKEIKELEVVKYVMATLDSPTQYLISEHFGKWSFTEDIQIATKTTNKDVANTMVGYFYNDVGLKDLDIVVLPLKIEYKLINEFE